MGGSPGFDVYNVSHLSGESWIQFPLTFVVVMYAVIRVRRWMKVCRVWEILSLLCVNGNTVLLKTTNKPNRPVFMFSVPNV